jgi:hypothetical protein
MAGTIGATLQAELLELLLNAVPIPNIADDAASTPATEYFVSLHTANPTNAGNQTSSEIAYTGYARVSVSRNATSPAWTITGTSPASASPNASITFGAMTAGAGGTATHAVIGTLSTGTGKIIFSGAISPTISVVNGISPSLKTDTVITMN